MKFFHTPLSSLFSPPLFFRKYLCGILSFWLIVVPGLSYAAGRKPGQFPKNKNAALKGERVPVEDAEASLDAVQSELDGLLSSDDDAEWLAEAPAAPMDPARAELEKLLASDESKNFWEDTKKLFESIPQVVEVGEPAPAGEYSYEEYSYRPPRAVAKLPAKPPRQAGATRRRGWPAVDPSSVPPGAKVQKVWIWQESADCLWNIAKEYYGDPYLWPKIYEANKHLIKDPNIIFPRQQLIIPPLEMSDAGIYPPAETSYPRSRTARRR